MYLPLSMLPRSFRSFIAALAVLALQFGVTRNALGLTCAVNRAPISVGAEPGYRVTADASRAIGAALAVAPLPASSSRTPAVPASSASMLCGAVLALAPASPHMPSATERAPRVASAVDRVRPSVAPDPPFHPPRLS